MIKLIIKNKEGFFDITQLASQISWSGDRLQCARSLDFGLISSASDKTIPTVKCDLGDNITLKFKDKSIYEGYVFSRTKSTNSNTIDISTFDRGIYLNKNRASYKFTNQTPEAITKRVCSDFGISVGEVIAADKKITRNFFGVTLYDIIQTVYTLASEDTKKKYQIRFIGDKLNVIEKKVNDETLVIEGGSNLMDATMTDSIKNMINQVAIYDKNDNHLRNIKDDNLIKLYGLMQDYIKQPDGENVNPKAQKILGDGGVEQKIVVNNLGNVANITGGTAIVREPYTGLYGLFYIDAHVHSWKKGVYTNKLTLNFKNLMDEKEVGSLPNKTGSKTSAKKATTGTWAYLYKPGTN